MKTKVQILSLLLAVSMVLSFSGALFAVEEDIETTTTVTAVTTVTTSGTVASIEADEQYLVIEQKGEGEAVGTSIFHYSSTVNVQKDGTAASLSDVKEGAAVTVQYATDENGNKVIDVLTIVM